MLEIRQTALRTYLRCPLQYYFRYVCDLVRPPGIAAVAGTSVHKAVEVFWTRKRDEKEIDYDEGYSSAVNVFEEKSRETVNDTEETTRYRKILPDLVNGAFRSVVQVTDRPLVIEQPVAMIVNNVRVTGTIDLVTEDYICWDNKTGKRYTPADADRSLQLTIYSLMADASDLAVGQGGLVWIRENDFVRYPTHIDKVRKERAMLLLKNTIEGIKRGDFPPCDIDSSSVWWCTPKWCGYHQHGVFSGPCKYGG